jgi:type I restriction enzyme S subunit
MKAGWKTVKLGAVARYDKAQGIHSGLPYVGLEHIESGTRKFIGSRSDMEVHSSTFLFNPNHVLYGRLRPYLRKVLVPDFAGHCSTEIFPILPSDDLDRSYLSYWLITESTTGAIDRLCNGARMPRANMEQALELEVPLPPLTEQKRIVALLDEAFAGIDKAKAKAQTSIQSLGTLVVSEFQSLVDKKGFERKPLPELASHTLGKMLDKKKNTGTPRPYLRNVNVRWFEFDLSDIHEMPIRDEEAARCQARKGDVLMCEGGYPGRCAIWRSDEPVFFQKALHRIRFNEKWMAEWFVNYMHSLDSSGKISEFFTGTGIQHLTGETLSKLEIPVPPKSEIEAYVRKISAIRDETNDLVANERAKLDALSELKTSLLAQAFAGNLAV